METISVSNPRTGQVAHFSVTGPADPRAAILQQRLNRNALVSATAKDVSGRPGTAVVEIDAGVRDEKGDLLKSVHGGGLDPDGAGDALGTPSGSGVSAAQAAKDAQVAADAVTQQAEAAVEAGGRLSRTAEAAAEAAGPSKTSTRSTSSKS